MYGSVYPIGDLPPYSAKSGFRFPAPVGSTQMHVRLLRLRPRGREARDRRGRDADRRRGVPSHRGRVRRHAARTARDPPELRHHARGRLPRRHGEAQARQPMKLYVDKDGTAPSPRRVRMYLAEKGIVIPVERLELPAASPHPGVPREESRRHAAGARARRRPLHRRVDRDLPLLRGAPPRAARCSARTPLEKAEIEMWTRRVEQYFYLPLDFSTGFARNPNLQEASKFFARWAGLAAGLFDRDRRTAPVPRRRSAQHRRPLRATARSTTA